MVQWLQLEMTVGFRKEICGRFGVGMLDDPDKDLVS
jgi:hypothetical protein